MKKCILIFDDDLEILLVCKTILEKRNYRVETRILCDNIIEDVRKVQPDVILMDLWIPRIGGENAINLLKHNKDMQHIPVFLFSANAQVEEMSARCSSDGFLRKPFDIAKLLEIIERPAVKVI